jgi:hypothetical protein
MLCYRDITFCSYYNKCDKQGTCGRELTPQVERDADEWWGSPGAPISKYSCQPECFKEIVNETLPQTQEGTNSTEDEVRKQI